jgi:hypothetical protein
MSGLQEKTERLIENIALDVICNGITTIYSNDKWTDIDPPKSFDGFKKHAATLFIKNLNIEVNSFINRYTDVSSEQLKSFFSVTDYYNEQDEHCVELHDNIIQILSNLIPFLNHFGYFNESDTWKIIVLPFLSKNFDNFNFKLKHKSVEHKSAETQDNEDQLENDEKISSNEELSETEEYEVDAEDGDVVEEVYKDAPDYDTDNEPSSYGI